MRHGVELDELGHHVCLEADEGPLVAHLIAVVGRTKHSDAFASVLYFISFLAHLMGAHQQSEVVGSQEVGCVVRAEAVAQASFAG